MAPKIFRDSNEAKTNLTGWSVNFDGSPEHVNHGTYYQPDTAYGKEFAEYLIKPTATGYFDSAGYGGAHVLLFGVSGDLSSGFALTGNVYNADTATVTSFTTVETIRYNQWAHVAFIYDGVRIIVAINGVPSSITPFTGIRKTNDQYEGVMYIGGSDHNNFGGRIAAIRKFTGSLPIDISNYYVATAFRPAVDEIVEATLAPAENTLTDATFIVDYRTGSARDISNGLATKQATTATAAGAITGTGNASVTVTARGMTNSPKTIAVAVVNGDSTSTWAGKVRTALAADADVSAWMDIHGATTSIIATLKAANYDSTFNIALTNGTSTGITPAATSADTTTSGPVGIPRKHNGYLAESVAGIAAGEAYNRTSAFRPSFVVDPFTWPTSAAAQKTQIASTRIYDDFSRADVHFGNSATLGLGTTRVGAKAWTAADYGINNGNAFIYANGLGYALLTDTAADGTVIVRRPSGAASLSSTAAIGVFLRYIDVDNWLLASAGEDTQLYLYQRASGSTTALGAAMATGGDWRDMRGVLSGSSVEVFTDGVSRGTRTTTILTCAKRGFSSTHPLLKVSEFGVI